MTSIASHHDRAGAGAQPSGLAAPSRGNASGLTRQGVRFAGIGVCSTLAYLLLFALLRTVTEAQAANVLALLLTAVANTAANRRLTFGLRGRQGAGRHQFQGLVVFAVGLGLTSGALAVLHSASPQPGRTAELGVLILANLAATVVRFVMLRRWVFRQAGTPLTASS